MVGAGLLIVGVASTVAAVGRLLLGVGLTLVAAVALVAGTGLMLVGVGLMLVGVGASSMAAPGEQLLFYIKKADKKPTIFCKKL